MSAVLVIHDMPPHSRNCPIVSTSAVTLETNAPRFSSLLLFPLAFTLLVLSRVHAITKNGLTMAYAPAHEGLVRANARLGRIAVGGVALATPPGLALLKIGGAGSVLYLASSAYLVTALLVFRLPQPEEPERAGVVDRRGRLAALTTAAAGTAGLRGASGFLLFLMAFAWPYYALLNTREPAWIIVATVTVMTFGHAVLYSVQGALIPELFGTRLRYTGASLGYQLAAPVAAGVAAFFAFAAFKLVFLALFAGLAGMATEFGRLAFQSLMQRSAPAGAHGRVFVRYEVVFQLSWVGGAFLPAVLRIPFRPGVLILAVFYLGMGLAYLVRPLLLGAETEASP